MFPNSDLLMTNPSNPIHPTHINHINHISIISIMYLQHHKQWQDQKWLSGCNVELFPPQDGQSGKAEEPPLFHHFVKGHQRVASLHVFCQYCNLTPMMFRYFGNFGYLIYLIYSTIPDTIRYKYWIILDILDHTKYTNISNIEYIEYI